jgi:Cytochrome P460
MVKSRITPTLFFLGAIVLTAVAYFLEPRIKAVEVVNGIAFPKDFQSQFVKFATVERPDGLIRDEFASQAVIDAARDGKAIPVGSMVVIQAFYGSSLGRLGQQNVHVMVKQNDSERNAWAFAAFNPDGSVEPNMDLTDCKQCHSSAVIGRDSIFSFALLQNFVTTGKPGFAYCSFPARIPCTSDADFSRGR